MQKIPRGHPHGQKSYQLWIREKKEKEKEDLKNFKINISNFFDPSFTILDGTFDEKPDTPPSLLTHSIIIVKKEDIPEETFFKRCLNYLSGQWLFSPFS